MCVSFQKYRIPVSVDNVNLTNCSYEYYPGESSAASTLLYIGNYLLYNPRSELCIYKAAE